MATGTTLQVSSIETQLYKCNNKSIMVLGGSHQNPILKKYKLDFDVFDLHDLRP